MKKLMLSVALLGTLTAPLLSNPENVAAKVKAEKNRVYGKLKNADAEKLSKTAYKDDYTTFGVTAKKKIINVVKLDFTDLPLDTELDKDTINEHITDWLETDAQITEDTAERDVYHSDKLNKNFIVKYTRNSDNQITMIKIMRGDVNGI
ncbi:hypothetical protein [Loigolactobacillus binensis]|uniref:Uncharacterized protein n=1 Tax=Loigolactobacillus binensis TaxID=2559922 RepID=A0ABW3EDC4_9LACO|nr:hypothetical protein [Loigolactobacillus binensis]